MEIEIKQIFAAHKNERGALTELIGYSYEEDVAIELAVGHGWDRGNGTVVPGHVLITADGIYLLAGPETLNEDLIKDDRIFREKALAKLSLKEREVLSSNPIRPTDLIHRV